MRRYLLFFLFVAGSFALADEGALGVVKIIDGLPARYDSFSGREIPGSTVISMGIKNIFYDEKKPDQLVLATSGDSYCDRIVLNFNYLDFNQNTLNLFIAALRSGFILSVHAKDLTFDSKKFLSVLVADAKNIEFICAPNSSAVDSLCLKKKNPRY